MPVDFPVFPSIRSSDIQKTFTEVFATIDKLLDGQIKSARDKGPVSKSK
jgi:hypothetical protein